MNNKKRFAPETVHQIQVALERVPPCETAEVSKQQAVQALLPQIDDLRAKGYGWAAIAAMLSERGLPVSPAALRTYLRRGRTEVAEAKVRRPTRRSARGVAPEQASSAGAHPGEAPPRPAGVGPGAAPSSAPTREGAPSGQGAAERTGTAPKAVPGTPDPIARAKPREPEPGHGFAVRPDSEDL